MASIIQPADQGVLYACKRLCKKKFLDEFLVIEMSDGE
jgi:hypothetical protein